MGRRFPRWVDLLVYPTLLAAVGYLTVAVLWDPQPHAHSCANGAPVAECQYAVGLIGHGYTWLVVGAVVGFLLALALNSPLRSRRSDGAPG